MGKAWGNHDLSNKHLRQNRNNNVWVPISVTLSQALRCKITPKRTSLESQGLHLPLFLQKANVLRPRKFLSILENINPFRVVSISWSIVKQLCQRVILLKPYAGLMKSCVLSMVSCFIIQSPYKKIYHSWYWCRHGDSDVNNVIPTPSCLWPSMDAASWHCIYKTLYWSNTKKLRERKEKGTGESVSEWDWGKTVELGLSLWA